MRFPSSDEALKERLSVVDAVAAGVDRQLARTGRLRRAILQHAFVGKLIPQERETGTGGDGTDGSADRRRSSPSVQMSLELE